MFYQRLGIVARTRRQRAYLGFSWVLILSAVLLPLAKAGIFESFREMYKGQGYVVSVERNGKEAKVKLIGTISTTNRTVAVIRTQPELWVAAGELRSKDTVFSGTQWVDHVEGDLSIQPGDTVFFAPRSEDDREGADEETSHSSIVSPPVGDEVGSVTQSVALQTNSSVEVLSTGVLFRVEMPEERENPSVVLKSKTVSRAPETNTIQQTSKEWRQQLLRTSDDELIIEWLGRLDSAIQAWIPGNDWRVEHCFDKLQGFGATNDVGYQLLVLEYNVKKGDQAEVRKNLYSLKRCIGEERFEKMRSELEKIAGIAREEESESEPEVKPKPKKKGGRTSRSRRDKSSPVPGKGIARRSWPSLELGGAVSRDDAVNSACFLNGTLVSSGGTYRGVTVRKIVPDGAWLEYGGEGRFLRIGDSL